GTPTSFRSVPQSGCIDPISRVTGWTPGAGYTPATSRAGAVRPDGRRGPSSTADGCLGGPGSGLAGKLGCASALDRRPAVDPEGPDAQGDEGLRPGQEDDRQPGAPSDRGLDEVERAQERRAGGNAREGDQGREARGERE